MAIAESGPPHNPFEYSKVIRESGITRQVDDMFSSLSDEVRRGDLPVQRDGEVFSFVPPISGIKRFSAVDTSSGTTDRVTVTPGFIEIKIRDKTGRVIAHLWNSPQAHERLRRHLAIFKPPGSQSAQESLPIA